MSAEVNKDLSRRWHEEVFNQRNVAAIEQFLHPNYINHSANVHGIAAAIDAFTKLIKDNPDLHLQLDDLIAEGDKVVTRWTWLQGGKATWSGITIQRIEDGKIIEDWFHNAQVPQT